MAKFCKYCGSELEENGVCFCEKAVNERTGVTTTAQIENFDVKQNLNSFLQVLKTLLKSRKNAYGISSYISSALFAILGFLITTFAIRIPVAQISSKSYGYVDISIGKCFLISLIITLVTVAVHTGIQYVQSLVKNKNYGFTPQVLSVGCINSFYYSVMLFICAICLLISMEFGAIVFFIALLSMIIDIANEIGISDNNGKFILNIVITAVIVAIVAIILWNAIYNISGLANTVNSIGSFL